MALKTNQTSNRSRTSASAGTGMGRSTGQTDAGFSNQDLIDGYGLGGPDVAPPMRELPGGLVDKIKKRLSTSWRDWKVSEDDATWVFDQLNRLSLRQVQAVVSELGEDQVERMLKAAPLTSMGAGWSAKVITALGADRVLPFCDSLMSRGAFDWFITDEDADAVGQVLLALPETQRAKLVKELDKDKVERLMRNLNTDHMLAELLSARFDMDFGKATSSQETYGTDWTVDGLRETWEVLEDLPEAHVEDNPSLQGMGRFKNNGYGEDYVSGYYELGTGNIGIQYGDMSLDHAYAPIGEGEQQELIVGAQVFEHTVRHEIGHAVDKQINGFDRLCKRPYAGHWKEHELSDLQDLAGEITDQTGGLVSELGKAERDFILLVICLEMFDGDSATLSERLANCYVAQERGEAWTSDLLNDPGVQALMVGMDKPWSRHPDGGIPVKGRIYQRSYKGCWTSYSEDARKKRVSSYQFRAPGEWFAEVYANYYDPRNDNPGDMLKQVDPQTKKWFDKNVHSMKNIEDKWDWG